MSAAAKSKSMRVAFQGEPGAFSEEAAVRLLGDAVTLVPRPTFEALFAAVGRGEADCALAPAENSLAGSVHRTYDLLLESSLYVSAEIVIPIRHFLIGCPGSTLEGIKTVESHPVALAQCERFFVEHPGIRRLATDDTAGSVARVVREGDPTRAAVAGRRAAEFYGGEILREHLEDHSENFTRFILLTPEPSNPAGADKLSLGVKVAHRPGALVQALEPFARHGLDLIKIESRPIKGRPWQYHFYLDLRAYALDPHVSGALGELRERADSVRVLGSYRSARAPEESEM